eukprot:9270682-Pyramimonas_sp.AAC.2
MEVAGRARDSIFSLPFRDWCPLWVYSLSPSAIGARYGYILSWLKKKGLIAGPSLDPEGGPW